MIPLLTLPVLAADMTWTCPTLTAPADALGFRDVASIGPEDLLDRVFTQATTVFDETCPASGLDTTDACHTAAGDAVALVHTSADLQLVVMPASGELTSFTGDWYDHTYFDSLDAQFVEDIRATVSWVGALGAELPPDASITTSSLARLGYLEYGLGVSTWEKSWDDGTCTWSVVAEEPSVDPDGVRTWAIEVGAQSLMVTEDVTGACTPSGAIAVLDGVSSFVDPGSWEPVSGVDGDGDGWPADRGDCDDTSPAIAPCLADLGCDGIDQDCDGVDSPDCDGDGYEPVEAGGDDCDETNAAIHPGARESMCDGVDQDCDGLDYQDGDGDGVDGCEDCDDRDARVYPGAGDVPGDGIDQDCDGVDAAPEAPRATPQPEACGGCGAATAPGWAGLLAALLWRRRRGDRAELGMNP